MATEPPDLRPDFWKTGEFYSGALFRAKSKGNRCCICGKPAGFCWRWRKQLRWTCATCYLDRAKGLGTFLDVTRMSDNLIGINGEEIIALQFSHQRNRKVTPEQEAAVLAEMKVRGWTW